MTSMESGHARAASLMHAARRSHFVSRIEKYEAKLKQEQKARAMLREQKAAVASLEQMPAVTEQQPSLAEKTVITEQVEVRPDQIGFRQYEREDSPEQKTISEHKEFATEPHQPIGQSQRTPSSGLKAVLRSNEAMNLLASTPAEMTRSLETKFSGGPDNFCTEVKPSPAIEVNVTAVAAALKIRIKAADMPPPMQEHAFRCARDTLDTFDKLQCKRVAFMLKKEFDKVYGPAWHCIVGTSFGSYVTHSLGGFVYFSLDKVSVLLFKTTVEPIEL